MLKIKYFIGKKGALLLIAPDPRVGMTAYQKALLNFLKVAPNNGVPTLSGANILVVQIAGMGDFTLATPAIRALRHANPSGKLDLLTSVKGKRAADGCPFIDSIDTLDFLDASQTVGISSFRLLNIISKIFEIRKHRYDIAINMMGLYSSKGAVRMGLFLRSLGTPLLAGRNTLGTGCFYQHAIQENLASPQNERDTHLSLIRHLGVESEDNGELKIWPNEEDEQSAQTILAGTKTKGPLIMVNPGSDRPEKNWPKEQFLQVMFALRETRGAKFLLAGGPAEAQLCSHIASALSSDAFNTVGKISYQGTASLMKKCDLVITSDTAALHLAWAADIPGVALFKKENLGRYRPATGKISCLTGNEDKNMGILNIRPDEVLKVCLEKIDMAS